MTNKQAPQTIAPSGNLPPLAALDPQAERQRIYGALLLHGACTPKTMGQILYHGEHGSTEDIAKAMAALRYYGLVVKHAGGTYSAIMPEGETGASAFLGIHPPHIGVRADPDSMVITVSVVLKITPQEEDDSAFAEVPFSVDSDVLSLPSVVMKATETFEEAVRRALHKNSSDLIHDVRFYTLVEGNGSVHVVFTAEGDSRPEYEFPESLCVPYINQLSSMNPSRFDSLTYFVLQKLDWVGPQRHWTAYP